MPIRNKIEHRNDHWRGVLGLWILVLLAAALARPVVAEDVVSTWATAADGSGIIIAIGITLLLWEDSRTTADWSMMP